MNDKTGFRSGFITIIGTPNAGKSTLMNYIVGQKISIVSARAQTTRNRIMGVYNGKSPDFDYQMIFIDTPGVTNPKNKLGEYMLNIAYEALNEVEAVLYIIDSTIGIKEKDELILERLEKGKAPVIAAINKTDISSALDVQTIKEILSDKTFIKSVFSISAKDGYGVEKLIKEIENNLVEGPMYFPEDMITSVPERFICSEMVREKTLEFLRDEIPHGVGVDIDEFSYREDKTLIDISATIYCEKDSHKGIIIGKKGSMIKQIGTYARMDMEWLLGSKVNLQLYVKVKSDWRNSMSILSELGYN